MQRRHQLNRKIGANRKEPAPEPVATNVTIAASRTSREAQEVQPQNSLLLAARLHTSDCFQTHLSAKRPVTLQLHRPNAQAVYVAATFNAWGINATALRFVGNDTWKIDLLLEPGEYPYRFVIDGHWMNDPSATQFAANGFGELNSILVVR